jgi:hypothetical protein
MSVDLNALATWTYENLVLTHVASQQSIEIDVASNVALHQALSALHWKTIGPTDVYSDDPADWTERSIRWNRATEDPPVIGVEQTIGAADYVDYTVIELEDDASFGPILDDIATILQDGHDNGFSSSHSRQLLKEVVRALQLANLL